MLVQGEHVTIERIVSEGHTSPESGWYEQKRHEWVIVLQGAATILFENGGANSPASRRSSQYPRLVQTQDFMDRSRSKNHLAGSALWLSEAAVTLFIRHTPDTAPV